MDPRDIFDTGWLRYGVSTADKEKLAREGLIPGAPRDNSAEQKQAERYAASYLFASTWPRLAQTVMPLVNAVRTSDLPLFGGDDPTLQSYAQQGMNRALLDRDNAYTTPVNTSARPWEDYRRPSLGAQARGLER